ncbi:hypothetical protein Q7C36_022235 [Tachysurus vachellii]|uniref:Ig-like domain-containing protein n=1 Tax=Tachysurus vachellii TaxID=175792 RepID=A0AA88LJ36_TACVA|nr:hypothetical protein Q7C36_022235 [Tachysurus vachellii]
MNIPASDPIHKLVDLLRSLLQSSTTAPVIAPSSSATVVASPMASPAPYSGSVGKTSVGNEKTYNISKISSEDSGEYKCRSSNEVGHQDSNSVTLNVLCTVIVIVYVSVGLGLFGLATFLSALFWLRSKRQKKKKKKADKGDNQNTGSSPKDNIYQNLEMSQISHPSPPADMPTSSDYENIAGKTSVGNEKTYNISKISSEDSGEYKCKSSNKVGHQDSSSVTLNVLYPPKNVSVSISPSGEIMEDSSVTLTCSGDANPPVQNYTWFKVNESSPVGSGQSYRAVQSGQYYCEAQNKHGSERSAAVSVTINDPLSSGVYAGLGVVLFVCICITVTFLSIRNKKRTGSTAGQSLNQDNLYANIAVTNQDNTVSDSASANQDEVLYTSVVHRKAVDNRTAESSAVKASASEDEEVQYASVSFKPRFKDF